MKTSKTAGLVLCAVLTALVAVLQFTGGAIRFGPFSMSVVLIPIVVGAAMCGTAAGAWLGLVFGAVVLLTDSTLFMAFSIPGTVVTVLLKGVLCGLCSALVFKALQKSQHLFGGYCRGNNMSDSQYGCVFAGLPGFLYASYRAMGRGCRLRHKYCFLHDSGACGHKLFV